MWSIPKLKFTWIFGTASLIFWCGTVFRHSNALSKLSVGHPTNRACSMISSVYLVGKSSGMVGEPLETIARWKRPLDMNDVRWRTTLRRQRCSRWWWRSWDHRRRQQCSFESNVRQRPGPSVPRYLGLGHCPYSQKTWEGTLGLLRRDYVKDRISCL